MSIPVQEHIIFPLTTRDQERLGMREELEEKGDTIAIALPPSRVREGIVRCEKHHEGIDPFSDPSVSDAIQTFNRIADNYSERVEQIRKQHVQERQHQEAEFHQQLNDVIEETEKAIHAKYEQEKADAKRLSDLRQTRLESKDKRISELKADIDDRDMTIGYYKQDFGERRTKPLNKFQRFTCWLFRI